ncbi:MAG: phosphoribosylanthranilate isomerase [Acidimicrobiales bacterium]
MVEFPGSGHFIKVCAVTTVSDATLVADAGADALGVILADSPRRVTLETAGAICAAVRGALVRVGVFRRATYDDVARALDAVELDALQVHGQLAEGVATLARERGLTLIEVLSVDELDTASGVGDAYLIDGPRPGSGVAHDWSAVTRRHWDRPIIVAGGLRADTVAEVLARVGAWGCDVASGSESSPGVKDREKVESFVRNALRYFEGGEEHHG